MIANGCDVARTKASGQVEGKLLPSFVASSDVAKTKISFADAMQQSAKALGVDSDADAKAASVAAAKQGSTAVEQQSTTSLSKTVQVPTVQANPERASPELDEADSAAASLRKSATPPLHGSPKRDDARQEVFTQQVRSKTVGASDATKKTTASNTVQKKATKAEDLSAETDATASVSAVAASTFVAPVAAVSLPPALSPKSATPVISDGVTKLSAKAVAAKSTGAELPVQQVGDEENAAEAQPFSVSDAHTKLPQEPVASPLPSGMNVIGSTLPMDHAASGVHAVLPNSIKVAEGQAGVSGTHAAHVVGNDPVVSSVESGKPNQIELGVRGGEFGWVKIRAELAPGGEVNTFLRGASAETTDALVAHVPAIQSFLGAQDVTVKSVQIELPQSFSHSTQQQMTADAGGGSSPQRGAGQRMLINTRAGDHDADDDVALQVVLAGQPNVSISGTGNWLSVRA